MQDKYRIVCFGDSLTYGHIPGVGPRYGTDTRWPAVMATELGEDYEVIEEGCSGRTIITVQPDMTWKSGLPYLYACLYSQRPLDMILVMLGTNNLHASLKQTMDDVEREMEFMLEEIKRFCTEYQGTVPKIVLMAPPEILPGVSLAEYGDEFPEETVSMSKEFAPRYERIAARQQVYYLNAALYADPSPIDGMHLTAEGTRRIGIAAAELVRQIR